MKNKLKHSCLFQGFRHEEEDQGVHRPLDQVLDGAGRIAKNPFPFKSVNQ